MDLVSLLLPTRHSALSFPVASSLLSLSVGHYHLVQLRLTRSLSSSTSPSLPVESSPSLPLHAAHLLCRSLLPHEGGWPTDSSRNLPYRSSTLLNKPYDAFADEGADDDAAQQEAAAKSKAQTQADHIHIRIQQRNGRKTITTLQGVPKAFDIKKLLKAFKKVSHSA